MSLIWEPLIKGTSKNEFCGPAALALLLNRPLDEVDNLLKVHFGTSIRRGLFYPEVLQILQENGCKVHLTTQRTFGPELFLIVYKRHFGVSKYGLYFDNAVPLGSEHYPRLRINRVYKVERQ
jgi:hypothetical protein